MTNVTYLWRPDHDLSGKRCYVLSGPGVSTDTSHSCLKIGNTWQAQAAIKARCANGDAGVIFVEGQGAKAFHASRDAAKAEREAQAPIGAKERTPAHVRAIMAYLNQRKYRANAVTAYRGKCESEDQLFQKKCRAEKREFEIHFKAQDQARILTAKRRRAILLARDFQKRLYREYDLVDQRAERERKSSSQMVREIETSKRNLQRCNNAHWKAREKMGARIEQLEAQLAATPVRRLMPRSALNGASVLALAIAA